MKKFRKSFVILPALATMALTTVASVTGTVAWFTATRSVSFTASTFTTATEDGKLSVTATAGTGTSVAEAANGSVDVKTGSTDNVMLDASYDGTHVWTDVSDAENSYKDVTSSLQVGTSNKYYAVTWSETFTVSVDAGTTDKYAIFFDALNSTASETTAGETEQGLRISMAATRRVVYSPFRSSTDTISAKFVNSTTTAAGVYTTPVSAGATDAVYAFGTDHMKSVTSGTTWANATGELKAADATGRSDYLGTTGDIANNETKLTVTFTAWFEGLDSVIKNNNDGSLPTMSSMSVGFHFYARKITA